MKPFYSVLAAVLMVTVAACSSGAAGSSASPNDSAGAQSGGSTQIAVVASTNVYGDIVKVVGGDAVTVTSVIDNPDKDPHEYEADAQTQLALSKAQLVVENGGGYDDFVDTMLSSAPSKPTVINVVDLSGYDQEPSTGKFNEHMWYDFPTMVKLADRLSSDLTAAAPDQAAMISANAKAFTRQLHELQDTGAHLKARYAGTGVAITEPVPVYLLDAAGLENKTPAEFSEAIEEGADVPPAVLRQTLNLFQTKQVRLLAYNEQTAGPQTETLLDAARRNGIAVVPVTETLPAGQTYLSWMQGNLDALSTALGN